MLAQAERHLRDLQGSGYGRGRATHEELASARRAVTEAKAGVLLTEQGFPGSPAIVALVLAYRVAKNDQDIQALAAAVVDMEARIGQPAGGRP